LHPPRAGEIFGIAYSSFLTFLRLATSQHC
jgi:hypothetical protein